MTIRLTQNKRFAGAEVLAGAQLTLASDVEAGLVAERSAVWVGQKLDLALRPPSVRGYLTGLFGDSMSDTWEQVQAPLSSPYSYDKASGLLTVTFASGHQQAVGWWTYFWDRNYRSLAAVKKYRVVARVDANTLQINVGANLPDVPDGNLATGSASMRPENLKNSEAWFAWFQYLSGNKFNVVFNGAQSGDTTAQALARLKEAVLDWKLDVVFCQMPGINDAGSTSEEVINQNRELILEGLSTVPRAVILTTTPVVTGEPRATRAIMQRVIRMNKRLREVASRMPNVTVVDAWRRIVNPTDSLGLAQTTLLRTTDLIHYSMRGGKLIADTVFEQTKNDFPTDVGGLPSSVADSYLSSAVTLSSITRTNGVVTATAAGHGFINGEHCKVFSAAGASEVLSDWVYITVVNSNTVRFPSPGPDGAITGTVYLGNNNNLMSNPLLTGAGAAVGGGITGNYASGLSAFLTGTPTCAASLVARADGFGQNQRTVVTFAAANDRVSVVTSITDILRHVKAGRTYVLEAELSLSGVSGSNLSEIRFNLAAVADGITYQTYALAGYTSGATLNSDVAALHVRTPPLVMPSFASLTQLRMDATFRGSAAGSALTVDIGRIALRELDGE